MKTKIIVISIVASILFLILNVPNLDAQGLYYDEVFQATASFAYIGKEPYQFSALEFMGIPILNMNYIGAIKTGIYGMYLKISNASFSVISWRLVGIISVSIALLAFGLITGEKLKIFPLCFFYFLFITDITLLVTTRFDWGPVALSLSFRLILIALWLASELSETIQTKDSLFIGLLLGILLFEKLTALVLILPILVMLLANPQRRNKKHVKFFILGGILGSFPLIFANLLSYYQNNFFISLANEAVINPKELMLNDFVLFIKGYLSLGAGNQVKSFILGGHQSILGIIEIAIMSITILIIGLTAFSKIALKPLRLSTIMLFCFLWIPISLYFLPANTWVHHWVLGTPFQYVMIILFMIGFQQENIYIKKNFKFILQTILVLFISTRLIGVYMLEQAYLRGDSSNAWKQDLTKISEFALEKSEEAIFIIGDWGLANQMICFVNGERGIVYEIKWHKKSISIITTLAEKVDTEEIYLVFPNPPIFTQLEVREALVEKIRENLNKQWHEVEIDSQLEKLDALIIFKFERKNN